MAKKLNVRKDTMKQMFQYVKKHSLFVALSILFAAVSVALTLYIPILVTNLYRKNISPSPKIAMNRCSVIASIRLLSLIRGVDENITSTDMTIRRRATIHITLSPSILSKKLLRPLWEASFPLFSSIV